MDFIVKQIPSIWGHLKDAYELLNLRALTVSPAIPYTKFKSYLQFHLCNILYKV